MTKKIGSKQKLNVEIDWNQYGISSQKMNNTQEKKDRET
jgi:hypothetical protein